MYTKILPPNMTHCQTLKYKYRLHLIDVINVATFRVYSLKHLW